MMSAFAVHPASFRAPHVKGVHVEAQLFLF